jgi:uncharacterized membrane protein YphA (DoxX/SURF4 family)
MLIAVWIVSGLLALVYIAAGSMKTLQPKEKLASNLPWVEDFTAAQVKLIGIVEFLGGLGLILPVLTGIAPILTPIAAVGLVIVQAVAMVVHIRRGEQKALPINAVLLLLAAFIAVARFAGV